MTRWPRQTSTDWDSLDEIAARFASMMRMVYYHLSVKRRLQFQRFDDSRCRSEQDRESEVMAFVMSRSWPDSVYSLTVPTLDAAFTLRQYVVITQEPSSLCKAYSLTSKFDSIQETGLTRVVVYACFAKPMLGFEPWAINTT